MDKLTKEQRSKNMRAVKNRDSRIELRLRHGLWQKGYRYRKNFKDVTGKPDIVFTKQKLAVFCDSEFWHGYDWDNKKHSIKSNQKFWLEKIESNIKRDIRVNDALTRTGWRVLRFWGKDIKSDLDGCIKKIEKQLFG